MRQLPNFAELFDRPVVILAAPRSGSTLLFETLEQARDVWTVGGESHQFIEGLAPLNPNTGAVDSNRLTAAHATPQIVSMLRRRFARYLRDRDGRKFFDNQHLTKLRFLEKTPKNALRQPFLDKVFPGALYIYLYREPRGNLSSMMEAWRAGRWVTYPRLRGWQGPPWSLLLPPGWQGLNGRPLQEICAYQWSAANRIILDDLSELPPQRWTACDYESLTDDPEPVIRRLCAFTGIGFDARLEQRLNAPLPLSRLTHTRPDAEKWRKNEKAILSVLDSIRAVQQRCEAALKKAYL